MLLLIGAVVTVVLTVVEWRTCQHRKGLSFPCCAVCTLCMCVVYLSLMIVYVFTVQWNKCYCLRRLQICCNHHKTYIHLIRLLQLMSALLNSTVQYSTVGLVYFSNVFRHFVSNLKYVQINKTNRQPNQEEIERKKHHRLFLCFFSSITAYNTDYFFSSILLDL